jgi:CRP/FNR family transcriptional regulator
MASQSVSLAASRPVPATASRVFPIGDLSARCPSCSMRMLCLPLGLDPDAMRQFDLLIANRLRVKKRSSLYRPGDRFSSLYAIRLGTVKTLVVTEDGREQITGFHMAGEVLGFDGIVDERHSCQAVALEDSEVCVLPFDQLDALAHDMPLLQRNLYRLASRDICRDQEMLLLLGSRCAEERLALFLLSLAERYKARGYSPNEFVLRMTREEIASFLGLKLETVSRLFSHLQEAGLIQVQGRAIKLLDLTALKRLIGRGD